MMLHSDRARAESFGADAVRYDLARPSYPRALVDELVADSPATVLDVGCGTGIAASLFQERGCHVLGVEPDGRMALLAQRKGLEVEIATFENWQARDRRFDLLVCAQAWHWIDPTIGAAKAASVLSKGGRLAVFWNFGHPAPDIKLAFDEVYDRLAPDLERYSVLLGNADRRLQTITAALAQTDRFAPSRLHIWSWARRYTTEEWLEHLLTHSDHKALAAARRDRLLGALGDVIDGLGGAIQITYDTHLVTARKR
jgi:SAM-dependent methyltransferase